MIKKKKKSCLGSIPRGQGLDPFPFRGFFRGVLGVFRKGLPFMVFVALSQGFHTASFELQLGPQGSTCAFCARSYSKILSWHAKPGTVSVAMQFSFLRSCLVFFYTSHIPVDLRQDVFIYKKAKPYCGLVLSGLQPTLFQFI